MRRRRCREDDICPHCGDQEDNLHLFECTSPAVTLLLEDQASSLQSFLNTSSCPPLISLLSKTFYWPRTGCPPVTPALPLQWAAGSQRLLGPHAGTWGFFSHRLISYLQRFWDRTGRSRQSATVWFSKLAHLQWNTLEALWKLRNQTLHSPHNSVTAAESDRVIQDIINLLEDTRFIPRTLIPTHERHLFRHPQATILEWSLLQRRRWLRQASSAYSSWLHHRNNPAVRPMLDFLLRETDVT